MGIFQTSVIKRFLERVLHLGVLKSEVNTRDRISPWVVVVPRKRQTLDSCHRLITYAQIRGLPTYNREQGGLATQDGSHPQA